MDTNKCLLLPLLLIPLALCGEPIVRIVDNGGSNKDFATDNVHKLVLTSAAVEVVNTEGTVLLSVPASDIVRVELTEGTPTSVDRVQSDHTQSTKFLRDGQLIILHNGTMYTIQGQIIKNTEQ